MRALELKKAPIHSSHLLLVCLLSLMLVLPLDSLVWADGFPSKPIKFIIPTTPGGTLDLLGRCLQPYLQKYLNVSVTLENIPGASHKIGLTKAWKSTADGYTIIQNSIPQNIVGEAIIYKTDYQLRDFTYICAISKVSVALFANWDSFQTLEDFLEESKKRVLVGGVSGVGSASHLSGLVAMDEMKVNARWVNFDSGGDSLTALAGKHVDFTACLPTTAFSLVRAKKIRPLVILDNETDVFLPATPTARQKGIEISPTPAFFGILGPPKMPRDNTKILEKAFAKTISDPALQKLSKDRALYISFMSGNDYKRETEKQYNLVEKYRTFLDKGFK
jgi:tripartite-type tricarboxylate transporter receptor subunit TctC